MKIYTRTGDRGRTSLLSGKQVKKNDPLIEAYGTVDELISYIGLVRDITDDTGTGDILQNIQNVLMRAASLLAAGPENEATDGLPVIVQEDVRMLEKEIDLMESEIPSLKSFIIPGGYVISSHCHIARTICRRAERRVVGTGIDLQPVKIIIQYLNRLSDFLFVLARWLQKKNGHNETIWKSGV